VTTTEADPRLADLPPAPPPYKPPAPLFLWAARTFRPLVAPALSLWWSRLEKLDGPFDGSDLLPPGVTEPTTYPPYYFMKHVHSMPDPGWMHPAMGEFYYKTARWGFYFDREDVLRYYYGKLIAPLNAKRILDVGCAIGEAAIIIAKMFPEAEVIGIDLSAPMLRWARREAERQGVTNVKFYHRDFCDLSYWEDGSFDFVYENYCLHEVPTYAGLACVKEMIRLTRPGGRIAFADWPPAEEPGEYEKRAAMVDVQEPFMLQYLDLRLEERLSELGMINVERLTRVGRNMLVKADKPA
jgi:SAM-dependent methyltransferase